MGLQGASNSGNPAASCFELDVLVPIALVLVVAPFLKSVNAEFAAALVG